MATFDALHSSIPVNIEELNLYYYTLNFDDFNFLDNIFIEAENGEVYEDYLVVYSFDGINEGELRFFGENFSFGFLGNITGGTVHAISEAFLNTQSEIEISYIAYGFDVPAVDIYNAALTPGTNDELSIILEAFSGDDLVQLSEFDDKFFGFDGNDTMIGGSGNDQLFGFEGADLIDAGDGFDTLNGGDGDDRLLGFNGDDNLDGGDGNDRLEGGDGDDTLKGGGGLDFLLPGAGNDVIDGGENAINVIDYYYDAAASGIAVTFTSEDAGNIDDGMGGTDIFSGAFHIRGTEYGDQFSGTVGQQVFLASDGIDTIDGGAGLDDWIDYNLTVDMGGFQGVDVDFSANSFADTFGNHDIVSNIENIWGSEFDDRVSGENGTNHFFSGNGGNDVLHGLDGNDTLQGGIGDDLLSGGDGNDVFVYEFLGQDTIENGAGSEDQIRLFILGPNGEQQLGGMVRVGDDLIIFGLSDSETGLLVEGAFADASAIETILYQAADGSWDGIPDSFFTVTLLGAEDAPITSNSLVVGTNADDTLNVGTGAANDLYGGSGNDVLNGNINSDWLYGGAGDDTLTGGAGDDKLLGGDGTDTAVINVNEGDATITFDGNSASLESSEGFDELEDIEFIQFLDGTVDLTGDGGTADTTGDTLIGTEGDDNLEGGNFDDAIFGLTGNDTLSGLGGDDNIGAAAGDDLVYGGGGDDLMGGGTGDDVMEGGSGDDFMGGGQDNDTVDGGEDNDVVNGGPGDDSMIGGDGNDTMGGSFGADTIEGNGGNDDMGGGAGQDQISAGAGNDSVGGGEANDVITGGGGDDFLAGGGRDDRIDGGTGNDTINGGDGDDTMTGGSGADIFVWNFFKDGDEDIITDFEDGIDSFRMVGVENAPGSGLAGMVAALNITNTAGGALIDYQGHTVLIEGVAAADLTVEDFTFL
ncbi:calcium-binding protein [Aestuariicoccus sp. MJ-SS9]|uniref:calcium-binding protein n=1 Tax=Aestuariicoccus sp. MJ-SS9 TaxID=3079855 RepID=UPI0029155CE8|nr:calcium-binding protein [Aestuariicoccus sp. MJ-SS9]MDU8913440.1 calcium-binding protein [Aestuariicoccus sp. MJ-SS9]